MKKTAQQKLSLVVILVFSLTVALLMTACPNETPVTYTVTYDENGNIDGSVPTDNNVYEQGATVTVLGNTGDLVKNGYSFYGWNRKEDGSGHRGGEYHLPRILSSPRISWCKGYNHEQMNGDKHTTAQIRMAASTCVRTLRVLRQPVYERRCPRKERPHLEELQ